MTQIPTPTEHRLDVKDLRAIWTRRRIFAFFTVSFSLFLLLILSWSFRVSAYRIDNDLRFHLESDLDSNVKRFRTTLLESMQKATQDDNLIFHISELKNSGTLQSDLLLESDLDLIREKIQVYTKTDLENRLAKVRVSFEGTGAIGEKDFVQRITNDILEQLGPVNDFTKIDGALSDVSEHLKAHLQTQERYSGTIVAMVDDFAQTLDGIGNRIVSVESSQPPAAKTLADSQRQLRQRQLGQLREQKDRLLMDYAPGSPEVASIQQRIDIAKFELQQIRENESPYGFAANPQFKNVSYFKNSSASSGNSVGFDTAGLLGELRSIEFEKIVSAIDDRDESRKRSLQAPIDFLDQINGKLPSVVEVDPAATLVTPGDTTMTPIGGKPGAMELTWITLLAMAFGGFVVWQLNPADIDRGFGDTKKLSQTLGVPVVSSFPLQSSDRKPEQNLLPAKIVRVSEWITLAALAGVIIACLFSNEIRNSILVNPIDGLARIAWIIKQA